MKLIYFNEKLFKRYISVLIKKNIRFISIK